MKSILPFLHIDDTHATRLSGHPVAGPYVAGIFLEEVVCYPFSMLSAVDRADFYIERFGVALLYGLWLRLEFLQLRIEHFEPLAPTHQVGGRIVKKLELLHLESLVLILPTLQGGKLGDVQMRWEAEV